MTQLDPRLNAFREDLAAASLKDRARAQRYAEGEVRQVAAPSAPIRIAPRFDAPLATEALSGEFVTAYEFREGWAWVQLHQDGYVGYTPVDRLSGIIEENTHRVSARLTYLYPAPDIKQPPITSLSFSSTVLPIGRPEGRFAELSRGGFIFADHLVGIRERARDYVRVAERFVGTPYLWGGKTALGIDCSGLVQISLHAAGIPCPRDTDMQMAGAGEAMDPGNLEAIQRGDLLFWKGHVAIAQSADWMVHASGHHMEVVVEPVRRALDRTAESHGPLLAILRPMAEQKPPAQKAPPPQQASPRRTAPQAPAAAPAQAQQTPPQATAPAVPSAARPAVKTAAPAPGPTPASPQPAQAQAAPPAQAQAAPPAQAAKTAAEINTAAKTVATQIHASLSAAPKEAGEKPAEPGQKGSQTPQPGEKSAGGKG
jgi:cell wall-associated NlpC family hydrolase